MGAVRKIALAVLVISFITFVALFGRLPALKSTPIGFLHNLIWNYIPRSIRRADQRLSGGRLTASASRCGQYLLNEKHPIVMVAFLGLIAGSATTFLSGAWHRLSAYPHHILIPLLLPQPFLFTLLAAYSDASKVTTSSILHHLRVYPYDHTLFHPGIRCRTCLLPKPPRSKHCSVCRACIARADHHCVWVNNCLGAANYRWFLALLLSTAAVLSYGAGLAFVLLRESPALGRRGAEDGIVALWNRWIIALRMDLRVGAVGLLAACTAPLACGLLAYHVYLVWAGMTTNEMAKWGDLRSYMEEGKVWKAKRRVLGGECLVNGTTAMAIAMRGPETSPEIDWPIPNDQIVTTTEDGDFPAPFKESSFSSSEVLTPWERCWTLAELQNLYDVGFRHNVKDALNLLPLPQDQS